jgi:hypothetical protein
MEGKTVPTIEVEIGKGEESKKVLLYQWLTQEEEDKYNAILIGDKEYTQDEYTKMETIGIPIARLNESNTYLMQSMCATSWEDINSWRPSLRNELMNKIQEIREKN